MTIGFSAVTLGDLWDVGPPALPWDGTLEFLLFIYFWVLKFERKECESDKYSKTLFLLLNKRRIHLLQVLYAQYD